MGQRTHAHTHSLPDIERVGIHLMHPRCLPEEFLFLGTVPFSLPQASCPATELLTQGKHLKTEWLPGRRKKEARMEWMGWGMATGRAQKILKLGDYQGWLIPEGSWAPAWRAWGSRCNACSRRWGQPFLCLDQHTAQALLKVPV